nr:transposase [Lutibacter sp. A64]
MCKNKRLNQNKVFKGIATTGKSTMGWFYGFKLHIIINHKSDILTFTITQANTYDRTTLEIEHFSHKIFGKLFADKGYMGKELAQLLFVDGVQIITQVKNSM